MGWSARYEPGSEGSDQARWAVYGSSGEMAEAFACPGTEDPMEPWESLEAYFEAHRRAKALRDALEQGGARRERVLRRAEE